MPRRANAQPYDDSNAPHVSWSSATRPSLEGRPEFRAADGKSKRHIVRGVGEVAQRVLALRPLKRTDIKNRDHSRAPQQSLASRLCIPRRAVVSKAVREDIRRSIRVSLEVTRVPFK